MCAAKRNHFSFKNVDRELATDMLLEPGLKKGTFMIRDSSIGDNLALSILDIDAVTKRRIVNHYLVVTSSGERVALKINDGGVKVFPSVSNMVEKFKVDDSLICCKLTSPYPKPKKSVILKSREFEHLEVDRMSVNDMKKIGEGNFGNVWKGTLARNTKVAIKELKQGTKSSNEILEEAKIMKELCHPRLVKLVGVVTRTEPFWIITEFMPRGSLSRFLRSDVGKKLELSSLIAMNFQIAEGMEYLESKKYIHRDLRADNILVNRDFSVKIADFGLSRFLPDGVYAGNSHTVFPIRWTAPEGIEHQCFTIKSDVWSFGCLMYEIINFGKEPYSDYSTSIAKEMIVEGTKPEKPSKSPPLYYDMMMVCMEDVPEDRPTFSTIKQFFEDFEVTSYITCTDDKGKSSFEEVGGVFGGLLVLHLLDYGEDSNDHEDDDDE